MHCMQLAQYFNFQKGHEPCEAGNVQTARNDKQLCIACILHSGYVLPPLKPQAGRNSLAADICHKIRDGQLQAWEIHDRAAHFRSIQYNAG